MHLITGDGILQNCHEGIEHGDIQSLAFTSEGAVIERHHDADHCKEPRHNIADRGSDPGWRTVLLACDAHDAAHALNHNIVGGKLHVRAALAETRNGGIDQFRIEVSYVFITQAPFFHRAGTVVFYEDISPF